MVKKRVQQRHQSWEIEAEPTQSRSFAACLDRRGGGRDHGNPAAWRSSPPSLGGRRRL